MMMRRLIAPVVWLVTFGLLPSAYGEVGPTVDISLKASRSHVTYGEGIALDGEVTSVAPPCVSNVEIIVYEDTWDDVAYQWTEVGRVLTDEEGGFSTSVLPSRSTSYRAELSSTAGCGTAASRRRSARVHMRVSIRVPRRAVERGSLVNVRVKVSPSCPPRAVGEPVVLQRFKDTGFVRVASKKPNRKCKAVFKRRIYHQSVFRAKAGKATSLAFVYFKGISGEKVIGTRAQR